MRFALNFCVKNVNNGWKKIHNDNNNIVTQKRNIFEVMYIFSIYNPIPILWSPLEQLKDFSVIRLKEEK